MRSYRPSLWLALLLSASPAVSIADRGLTPEQQQKVTDLRGELDLVQASIASAVDEDLKYTGGAIKSLIAYRLEILRINEALLQQRIQTIESGAGIKLVVNASDPDPERAAELLEDILAQRRRVDEARRRAEKYSGGLVRAMAQSTAATASNTLAMLEQQYFAAKYGIPIALPAGPTRSVPSAPTPAVGENPEKCLEITDFGSSVVSSNPVYSELAWKVDIASSCRESYKVEVRYKIRDKDDFQLEEAIERISVSAGGVGKARGIIFVLLEKVPRMDKEGATIRVR